MYKSNRIRENYPTANSDVIADIADFHQKFDLAPRLEGAPLDKSLLEFRLKFLAEELIEANKAAAQSNLVDLLDALVDMVYVAVGTAYTLNLDFAGAWQKVHFANMAKVKASDENPSKRGHASDIVKPAGWFPPDHTELFLQPDLEHEALGSTGGEDGLIDLQGYINEHA